MTKDIDPRDYMAEFLAAGKTVTQVPTGQRSDPEVIMKFMGGRPKKAVVPVVETKPKKAKK